jgi:MFS family permease
MLITEAAAALICSPISGYLLDRSRTRQALYLFGLAVLLASMSIFTAAFSIACYIGARVLQGAATAMVTVAGFTIVTDTVHKAHLGYILGYMDVAVTLGLTSGPLLGGLVYQAGGYYTVCVMAFGILVLDILLRVAVIEKKTAEQWLTVEIIESTPISEALNQTSSYGTTSKDTQEEDEKSTFAMGILVQQPRLLVSTWALALQALLNAALEAVRII